ncbi:Wzz/FepE/Etk N-terminal domain-containing protein [Lactiplantibacillus sp. WILCCON 0030]|uniref:Wzz/FepE/Etk N-terminal domain-containing protein n=1 Tax=Lactiplantibacillus brownii TaxID=3069269 RepID=A0ABU1A7W5_9LACO|nr:Wzz/FepE/Etk N-terminal domain-containing protein [Lactiplantibacillus brownii]MDQ7936961.1 Wzz/FepE/Etk N-terminal domain-containing protein [Lactiplantibacillus brownii]
MKVDLESIRRLIVRYSILIILFVIVFGGIGYTASKFLLNKTYTAQRQIMVKHKKQTETQIQIDISLMPNYSTIVKDPIILNEATGQLKKKYPELSEASLQNNTNAYTQYKSTIFVVQSQAKTERQAVDQVNTISRVFASKINTITNAGEIKLMAAAQSGNMQSPSDTSIALIGAVVGLLFGLLVVLMNSYKEQKKSRTSGSKNKLRG